MTTRRSPYLPPSRLKNWQTSTFRGTLQGRVRSARTTTLNSKGAIQTGASGAVGAAGTVTVVTDQDPDGPSPDPPNEDTLWITGLGILSWYDTDNAVWVRAMSGAPVLSADVHQLAVVVLGSVSRAYGRYGIVAIGKSANVLGNASTGVGDGAGAYTNGTNAGVDSAGSPLAVGYQSLCRTSQAFVLGPFAENPAWKRYGTTVGSRASDYSGATPSSEADESMAEAFSVQVGYKAKSTASYQTVIGSAENRSPEGAAHTAVFSVQVLHVGSDVSSPGVSRLALHDSAGVAWQLTVSTSGTLGVTAL